MPHLFPVCFFRCLVYTTLWILRPLLHLAVCPKIWNLSPSCIMLEGPPKWSNCPIWWWNLASVVERDTHNWATTMIHPLLTEQKTSRTWGRTSGLTFSFAIQVILLSLKMDCWTPLGLIGCVIWELLWQYGDDEKSILLSRYCVANILRARATTWGELHSEAIISGVVVRQNRGKETSCSTTSHSRIPACHSNRISLWRSNVFS